MFDAKIWYDFKMTNHRSLLARWKKKVVSHFCVQDSWPPGTFFWWIVFFLIFLVPIKFQTRFTTVVTLSVNIYLWVSNLFALTLAALTVSKINYFCDYLFVKSIRMRCKRKSHILVLSIIVFNSYWVLLRPAGGSCMVSLIVNQHELSKVTRELLN